MPMYGHNIIGGDGKVIGIACSRHRTRACTNCNIREGGLECDGCDKPLCAQCSVPPRKGLDFCPTCAKPIFEEWCDSPEGKALAVGVSHDVNHGSPGQARTLRRMAFRAWAKKNPTRFDALRTRASKRAVPPPGPQELWLQAGGDTPEYSKERYVELMIQHGHLIPKEPT